MGTPGATCTIVIATRNRRARLSATLERLGALGERLPIVVVDDASDDGTARTVRERFPSVVVLESSVNAGAAARNAGARAAESTYLAFCDDDQWWKNGSIARACAVLDRHPRLALVNARVCIGDEAHVDPAILMMETSPLRARDAYPFPAIASFFAGSIVCRRDAFLDAGGYHPRFFIGGEEPLLALDLMQAGWDLGYLPDTTIFHEPATEARDPAARRATTLRNLLWTEWLRMPFFDALTATAHVARKAMSDPFVRRALTTAVRDGLWTLRERRPVSREVAAAYRVIALPA